MTHKQFTTEYAKRLNVKEATAERYVNTMLQIMCEGFEKGESVTVKNMGRFYCKNSKHSYTKVFKFTPARRIKDILGWA